MKFTHAGDLSIDGEPCVGVFLSGTRKEVSDFLHRHLVGDEVETICAIDCENCLTSQEKK